MAMSMALPTGPAVTFLFSDIEGSTRLERAVGSAAWRSVVARHDALVRSAVEHARGVVVKTEGDAFFAAFERPLDGLVAAVEAQRAIAAESWPAGAELRLRIGLHLGVGRLREVDTAGGPEDYVGIDVNYTARIEAAGNGGQILLSDALAAAVRDDLETLPSLRDLELVDAGLQAVKDFEEPARLHRLVVPGAADDTRPLRTLTAPSNLPADVTVLVGRDAEIATVSDASRSSRIVTLTGPGGSGKTRLAIAVARAIAARYAHGTWFVDLAALANAAELDAAIAASIGLRETTEQPIAEVLRDHLRDRDILLVLDNLEQLLPAAAGVISSLIRVAPGLRIIATSREVLRIAGERVYPVPPLGVEAGVALFEERARDQRPDLSIGEDGHAAIRAISERLGGLPLAIELAAARVRTLSPTQILDRLGRSLDLVGGARDVPERQRTLRAAITWSHDLLSEAERRLFRRLAVFAGGWTLDEAEAVTNTPVPLEVDLVDGLGSLVDKSLVRLEPIDDLATGDGEVRYSLHPLLREYGAERLEEAGERAALEEQHAVVMTELAERLGAGILAATGESSMRHLDHEAYNVRAALDWSRSNGRPDLGLRLIGAIWRWYHQRGRLREGRTILSELLAASDGVDPRVRIAGLAAEGGLAYWMDAPADARSAYEARFRLAEAVGDPVLVADGHYDLGFLSIVESDAEGLRTHEQAALDRYLAAGREDGAIRARQALVLGVFLGGDYDEALELEEANLAAFRRWESASEVADSVTLESAILFRLGRPTEAWERMSEGLRSFSASQLYSGIARNIAMAAIIQLVHGDAELGARIAGAAHELARQHQVMLAPIKVLHLPDPADLAAARFGAERAAELLAAGAAGSLTDAIDAVLAADPPERLASEVV
jgi:predicted ATPase/class 3 adenylate cyclase